MKNKGKNIKNKKMTKGFIEERGMLEDKIAMWSLDLTFLDEEMSKVKTTKYDDDFNAGQGSAIDKVDEIIDLKLKIEEKKQEACNRVLKINTALERLELKHKGNYDMFKMHHIEEQTIEYVGSVKGYNRNAISAKLIEMEAYFIELMSC